MIRLAAPVIEEDEVRAVREVLLSGSLVQGKCVAEFEGTVAKCAGTVYAIAVSNCTAALHLSLLALNLRQGDKVLVTTYSWPATANAIELCGAEPVFVDIDPVTFNMDPDKLREALDRLMKDGATAPRVRAILPVHIFGQIAPMPEIMRIASQFDVPVIEDAACALGARLGDRSAGAWGALGCFSFHPRKAVTTGEGGVIVTDDPNLARQVRALRNHGLDPDAAFVDFILPGFNYRMTEFQAALGNVQMARFESILRKRRELALRYDHLLKNTSIKAPAAIAAEGHVYQSYVVLLPEEAAPRRADLIGSLKEKGIETTIGTYHMPLTTYFSKRYGYAKGDFPVTDDVFTRSLSLPFHYRLSEEEQEETVRTVVDCMEHL